MQDVLGEIVGDRARPSGGVNTQITSDSAPILRRFLTGGELRDSMWMYRLLTSIVEHEERELEFLVSADFSPRLKHFRQNTQTHTLCAGLQLIYSKVIRLFGGNKHFT